MKKYCRTSRKQLWQLWQIMADYDRVRQFKKDYDRLCHNIMDNNR